MKDLLCEICGMTINDRNYDYNKEAFLEENQVQYVRYCPFCGVKEIYLGENFKILEADKDKIDEVTLNILDHAVKLEIFNGDFYDEASKICSDKANSDIFKALSNIEYMHARIHRRLGGFKTLPKISRLDYSKFAQNDEELFKQAESREIHAVNYYKKYYDLIQSEEIRKVFKALSLVEQDHIKLTGRR